MWALETNNTNGSIKQDHSSSNREKIAVRVVSVTEMTTTSAAATRVHLHVVLQAYAAHT